MKKLIFTIAFSLVLALGVNAQCVIDTSVNVVGLYPPDSTFPCIERNKFFDEVIQFKNFDLVDGTQLGFGGVLKVISVTITNISNIPNGISYACNPANCTWPGDANGCVLVSGKTNDPVGTYNLGFTADVTVDIGGGTIVGPIQIDSATLAGAGLGYRLVVIEPNTQCPNLPLQSVQLSVNLSGNPNICAGDTTTITATPSGGDSTSYSFVWSPSTNIITDTSMAPELFPATTTTYSVTVTDGSGDTVTRSVPITVTQFPVAAFDTTAVNGDTVIFNNTSTGSIQTHAWSFGDGGNSSSVNPSHIYDTSGTYTVRLIVSNMCGTDSVTKSISTDLDVIDGVNDIAVNSAAVSIAPNPNNGVFELSINTGNYTGAINIRLIDVQGKEVYTTFARAGQPVHSEILTIDQVKSGVYFLRVEMEKEVFTQKILITN